MRSLVFLTLLVIFYSCSSDGEKEVQISKEILVDYELVGIWGAPELRTFVGIAELDLPAEERLLYDVDVYNLEYRTDYKGEIITVSGKVFMPKGVPGNAPTVCFSHGTIGSDAEAFSNLSASNNTVRLLSALAGMGIVVVAPDLVGFGASATYYHPYYVQEITATASVDGIYAAKLVADELAIGTSNHLYLAGYSQGGFSTMSTHKWIEENGIDYFDLRASFPAAGGYDIQGMEDYFFEQEVYDQPFYLAYVANAYVDYYDWTELTLSDVFNEPYASLIPDVLDGSYTGQEINDFLNDTVAVLVNSAYLNNPNEAKFQLIKQAYADNSPINWVPSKPVFMYHGDADITVPYQNSRDVYDQFIDIGASTSVVTLTTLDSGTHSTGVVPYIEGFTSTLIAIAYE
ncbi:S9 family peptidase [Marinoscillum sp. MHG1-6]|uniref:alpha/beta hydrolase family protein n=1 Tax=Marinoscillum sp. MHG1-6 TaxID=2959627 RepID=UPI0021582A29|nr:hypothetical protein [Marinoscillum sp. MHG1-6]